MTMTFTSRDVGNHALERIRHLVNRIVVFLQYCAFFLSCEASTMKKFGNNDHKVCIKKKIANFFFSTVNQYLL